jgi:cytochrome c oxidase cbb3-type subunit 1
MWSSGISEGAMWRAIDAETGKLIYPDWIEITEILWPFRLVRAIGGTLFLTGFILQIYNLIKTMTSPATGSDHANA